MRRTSPGEMEAVLHLDGPSRYEHFVKRVVDSEAAWGLWNDGWALMGDDSGAEVFPLWPAIEYADACATGEWSDYAAVEIPLRELLDEVLPMFAEKGIRPAVFPTPGGRGVTATPDELRASLRNEMERYGE